MPFAALTTVLGAARYSPVGVAVAVMPSASPTAGRVAPVLPRPRPWPYRGADQGAPGRDAGARKRTSCQAQSREEIAMSTAEALTSLVSDGRTELREGYADVADVQLHYV